MEGIRLQDILAHHREQLFDWSFTHWHHKVLQAIRRCRTAELGGHIDKCDCCKALHLSYNSCRNRHCPRCQAHKREQWVQARENELLDTPYYHLVFTLPSELNTVVLQHQQEVYSILFAVCWATVKEFAHNHLNATPGMIAILHTWGSNMSLHPHLHCIVPAGGIDTLGNWIAQQKKRRHLFPVKRMSPVFRAKMVALLRKKQLPIGKTTYESLFQNNWVVHAEPSFKRPIHVLKYLGRYTHRIAISDGRIVAFNKATQSVSFKVKDYRKQGEITILTLPAKEFVKRFQLHILPHGFTRIRHYGLLSSTLKRKHLKKLQAQLSKNVKDPPTTKEVPLVRKCPTCGKGNLHIVGYFGVRGPPKSWLTLLQNT